MEYILIFITAIFVNNIVLSQFLGICPFLGVSKKVETAMGMGAAVAFVLVLATIVTYIIQKFVLDAFGLGYLQTIAFILVIAALVQMVEIILKKVSPALYQALGVFLPLITTNCCILGVTILVIQKDFDLLTGVVYAFSTALGFALALIVFEYSEGNARHVHCSGDRRSAGNGIHGFLRSRQRLVCFVWNRLINPLYELESPDLHKSGLFLCFFLCVIMVFQELCLFLLKEIKKPFKKE